MSDREKVLYRNISRFVLGHSFSCAVTVPDDRGFSRKGIALKGRGFSRAVTEPEQPRL
jgi:hypothetical protein